MAASLSQTKPKKKNIWMDFKWHTQTHTNTYNAYRIYTTLMNENEWMREQSKYASTHTFAYLLIIFECIKMRKKWNGTYTFSKNEDETKISRKRERESRHTERERHVSINKNNVQDFIETTRATTE